MFMGQVGCGKTHLSLVIANELMDDVYYHRVMGKYKGARVLLIDGLFKENITESDINIVFELLNYRYFNKLPLIVSCELCVEDILKIDEAIGSRLVEMSKTVQIKGKKLNYRIFR